MTLRQKLLAFSIGAANLNYLFVPALADSIVLDKRTASSNTAYQVQFCARNSPGNKEFPGHCYMVWSKQTGVGPITKNSYGFYPNPDASIKLWKLATFPGQVMPEDSSQTNPTDCTVTVLVSEDAYNASNIKRKSYETQNYVAGLNDCVSACNDIAASVDIKHLDGTSATKPKTFIHELFDLNKNDSIHPPP
ncbi:hypothetical protein KBF38_22690 [bacterium]|nr:hypothetical protein [bacterium]